MFLPEAELTEPSTRASFSSLLKILPKFAISCIYIIRCIEAILRIFSDVDLIKKFQGLKFTSCNISSESSRCSSKGEVFIKSLLNVKVIVIQSHYSNCNISTLEQLISKDD